MFNVIMFYPFATESRNYIEEEYVQLGIAQTSAKNLYVLLLLFLREARGGIYEFDCIV